MGQMIHAHVRRNRKAGNLVPAMPSSLCSTSSLVPSEIIKPTLSMEIPTSEERYATRPCRILVQTKTHLVQGNDYNERCKRMRNIICRHFWERDFDPNQERSYARADFGYPNRRCFFLVDHGQSNVDDVPIRWYKWTGISLSECPFLVAVSFS